MSRREEKFLYRCTKQECREECIFNEKQDPRARLACPGCFSPLEFIRGPVVSDAGQIVNPRTTSQNKNLDATTAFDPEETGGFQITREEFSQNDSPQLSPNASLVQEAITEHFRRKANPDGTLVINDVINTREATHGPFYRGSHVAQSLKQVLWNADGWHKLSDAQHEALEQICSKISRIVVGNAGEVDHWIDIAGYASLIKELLTPKQSST